MQSPNPISLSSLTSIVTALEVCSDESVPGEWAASTHFIQFLPMIPNQSSLFMWKLKTLDVALASAIRLT
ncbi:hypothetical protein [Nostoc sp.]|uniref:hypothetical protein n=1 Tax=Nostoc sp. TaxID=1180 RepID=UPI002FF7CBE7